MKRSKFRLKSKGAHPGGRTRSAADAALVERYRRALATGRDVAGLRALMVRRGVDPRGALRISRECPLCHKERAPLEFPRQRRRKTRRRIDSRIPAGACVFCRRAAAQRLFHPRPLFR